MKPQLVLSTTNPGKVVEIADRIGHRFELLERPSGTPPVVEDAADLEGNARLKADVIAAATGERTLADDTGLEVDALGGAPGVRSARYAGPEEDAEANVAKLLADLAGVTDRRARFRTVLVLTDPEGETIVAEGVVEGVITEAPRGSNGFGYDPVFVPAGHEETFAEMSLPAKQAVSHRARALDDLERALQQQEKRRPPSKG